MMARAAAVNSRSTATCHRCPNQAEPIFQSVRSAASAPLIESFMWMTSDHDGEGAVGAQMCFPIKSRLQRLFLQRCEAKLFNQTEQLFQSLN